MRDKSPPISAFLMCIREDVGNEKYEIVEAEKDDKFTVTMKFKADPKRLCRVRVVTSVPPSYQVNFISISGALDMDSDLKRVPQKYKSVLELIKATYRQ